MTSLPIVLREISVLSRRRGLYAARFTLALGAVLVAGWLLASSLAAVTSAEVGRSLFVVLSSAAFAYAMLAGVHVTSDCLSEEKREDTLGLLFLTDLKGYDIVLGKMAAGSLNAAFALLATVPILALAIFLGGVSLGQIGQVTVTLASSIALSLGAGVLVSSVSTNERKSMFGTLLLLALLTFGPFLISILVNDLESKPPEELILFSPIYPLLCQFSPGGGFNTAYFWPAVIVHFSLAAAFVAAASRVLPRFVNDLPRQRFQKIRDLAQRMTFGSAASRHRHRAALLDRNAFLWLAGRERLKSRYAWGLVALFAGVYLWMGIQFPDLVFELPIALVLFFLLHFAFKLWLASEVCSRLIEDRRSGALELLLSTPLTVQQIAHGQTLALHRIFLKPAALLLVAEFALFLNMFDKPRALSDRAEIVLAMIAAPSTLLLDFWCLKWVGLWLSLRGKSIERVLVGTTLRIMALPWILFIALLGIYGAASLFGMRLRLEDHAVFAAWIVISLALPPLFAIPARLRFLRGFREAATQRFDAPAALKEEPAPSPLPPTVRVAKKRFLTPKRLTWAAALALFIGLPAARRAWWNAKLDQEVRRIQAEGLPTGFQNLAAFYGPVPAREDATAGIKDAGPPDFSAFGKRPNPFSSFGLASYGPLETQHWRNVQLTVAANARIIAEIRQAARRPKAYFNPEIDPWRWSFRQDLFAASAILWMQGIFDCTNNPAQAREDVLDLIRLGGVLQSAPALPAQTAALHTFHRANNLLERIVHAGLSDPAFLQQLSSELARAHSPEILRRALIVRRAMLIDRARNPIADPFMPRGPMIAAVHGVFDGIGVRQKWLCQLLLLSRTGIESASLPESQRLEVFSKLDRAPGNAIFLMPEYIWQSFEMDGVVSLDLAILARVRVLHTAAALERHRLEKGALPQSLAELADLGYLSQPPLDPFDGESLKFKDGKILYSIGQDRKDNAGKLGENYGFDLGFSFVLLPSAGKSR